MARGAADWTRAVKLLGIGPSDELLTVRTDEYGNLRVTTIPHHTTHEDGGSDEVNVGGLSGVLADPQPAKFVYVGSRATFPSPAVAGRMVYATDEGILYRDDGVSWLKAAVKDHADLDGIGPDDHHSKLHQANHQAGGIDALPWGSGGGLDADLLDGYHASDIMVSAKAFQTGTAFPASPSEGWVFYRTDLDKSYYYDGVNWIEFEHHAHHTRHENGGDDEISVAGLSGLLADAQTPLSHASTHQNGGADEIAVGGLSGELADHQKAKISVYTTKASFPAAGIAGRIGYATDEGKWYYDNGSAWVSLTGDPISHAARHQNGGADEINVGGLSGVLADPQTPAAHASTHAYGGADALSQLDTSEGLSALLPRDGSRNLTGLVLSDVDIVIGRSIDNGYLTVLGSTASTNGAYLLFCGGDYAGIPGEGRIMIGDRRSGYVLNSKFKLFYQSDGTYAEIFEVDKAGNVIIAGTYLGVNVTAHASRHQNGGADEISVAGLSGVLADAQVPQVHGNSKHSEAYAYIAFPNATAYTGTPSAGWVTIDLSSWVGAHKGLVLIRIHNDSGTNTSWAVATNGDTTDASTGTANAKGLTAFLINAGKFVETLVQTDASGYIAVYRPGVAQTITLKAYIRQGA